MGMNWRQLLLVVLVAAIVGGASGFIGNQVSARWESVVPQIIRSLPFIDRFESQAFSERRERDRQDQIQFQEQRRRDQADEYRREQDRSEQYWREQEMQRRIDCMGAEPGYRILGC